MHDSHKIRTLLACIDDLTKAVEEMSAEANIHQADQDLLLYRSRLFYEAVLCMPTAAAVAPVAAETTAASKEEVQAVKEVSEEPSLVEAAIEHSIVKELDQAIVQGQALEVDLSLEVEASTEENTLTENEAAEAADAHAKDATPPEADLIQEVVEVVSEETSAPEEVEQSLDEEVPVVTEPLAANKETTPIEAPSAKGGAAKSVAFSLTGIIERTGDSHLVMAHLKLKPIDDLKSGIGLNEKFLFIRELFGNDHLAYADAIEKLNAAPNLDAAEQILATEVLPKQQWDLETEAALSFLHLIFRRFAQA